MWDKETLASCYMVQVDPELTWAKAMEICWPKKGTLVTLAQSNLTCTAELWYCEHRGKSKAAGESRCESERCEGKQCQSPQETREYSGKVANAKIFFYTSCVSIVVLLACKAAAKRASFSLAALKNVDFLNPQIDYLWFRLWTYITCRTEDQWRVKTRADMPVQVK